MIQNKWFLMSKKSRTPLLEDAAIGFARDLERTTMRGIVCDCRESNWVAEEAKKEHKRPQ